MQLTWAVMQLHMFVQQCWERTQIEWNWGNMGEGNTTRDLPVRFAK